MNISIGEVNMHAMSYLKTSDIKKMRNRIECIADEQNEIKHKIAKLQNKYNRLSVESIELKSEIDSAFQNMAVISG
jgi:hypothetical protein